MRPPALAAGAPSWREATVVYAIFVMAQVLDGVLTYIGVSVLGVEVEANAVVAGWMELIGTAGALLGAKLLACGCGYILYRTAWHRPLAATAGLYLGVAVIPWMAILADLFLTR